MKIEYVRSHWDGWGWETCVRYYLTLKYLVISLTCSTTLRLIEVVIMLTQFPSTYFHNSN